MTADIEPIVGRYVYLEISGRAQRLYFEEAGAGIPLLCLHTAGADGRQFRHLMLDAEVTDHYRVIAFDMPWHGKSLPPAGYQDEDYQLTTQLYAATIRAFSAALTLDRPVVMGCSMGGRIALHLARAHADEFRAVIGLEAADHQTPWYDTEWLHRPDVHGGEVCAALISGLIAPHSPSEARWETLSATCNRGPACSRAICISTARIRIIAVGSKTSTPTGVRFFCSPANMISPASLAIPCAPPQRSRARKR